MLKKWLGPLAMALFVAAMCALLAIASARSVKAAETPATCAECHKTCPRIRLLSQDGISYEKATRNVDVRVFRGDNVSIPYFLDKDITGWTVWFGAKANSADTEYVVPMRDITASVTNAATGSGLISLSTTDTDVLPRRYQAELQIRRADSVNATLQFNFWVDTRIIRQQGVQN